MFPHRKLLLFLLMTTMLLAGCGGLQQPAPKIEYYNLEYDSPVMPVVAAKLPVVLRVEGFSASPMLQTNRIAYRDKKYSNKLYFYHRWRSTPAELVTHYLTRDLQQSGLFEAVSTPLGSLLPTHTLEGTVNKFMEWDDSNGWQAVIALHVSLIDVRESKVISQQDFTSAKPCKGRTPREVAAAMSQAMGDISNQIATHVQQVITSRKIQ